MAAFAEVLIANKRTMLARKIEHNIQGITGRRVALCISRLNAVLQEVHRLIHVVFVRCELPCSLNVLPGYRRLVLYLRARVISTS